MCRNTHKIFVEVTARFDADGGLTPLDLIWEDGRHYPIDRILDVADLTVDGSLATGGAVCVMLIRGGFNPWIALLCAMLAGMLAGLVTGLFHTKCGIPAILAGILTQLSLYSVNLRIMESKANQAVGVDKYPLMVSQRYVRELSMNNPLPLLLLFTAAVIAILYWFFGTEKGSSLRATGANPHMARAQGINTNSNIVLGLMVSNGLVALSGALLAQYQGQASGLNGPFHVIDSPVALNHILSHRIILVLKCRKGLLNGALHHVGHLF